MSSDVVADALYDIIKAEVEAPLLERIRKLEWKLERVKTGPTIPETIHVLAQSHSDIGAAPVRWVAGYIREHWTQDEIVSAYLTGQAVLRNRSDPRSLGFDTVQRPSHLMRLSWDIKKLSKRPKESDQ